MLYVSTDYVFPGKEGDAPYDVDAAPSPPNLYGQTKLDGERAMLEAFKEGGKEGWGVVVRVPVLYGQAEVPEESAVNVLMNEVWKSQAEGVKVKMDDWSVRYPTNTEDAARVMVGESLFPRLTPATLGDGTTPILMFMQMSWRNTLPQTTRCRSPASSTSRARIRRPSTRCARCSGASWASPRSASRRTSRGTTLTRRCRGRMTAT